MKTVGIPRKNQDAPQCLLSEGLLHTILSVHSLTLCPDPVARLRTRHLTRAILLYLPTLVRQC